MNIKKEIKIKHKIIKDRSFLLREHSDDIFLTQLVRYLFAHRSRIFRILEILNDETVKGYGGNQMYTKMEGPVIFIYDGYDDDPEEFGIRINRSDLIEIFKSWQEVNEIGNIKEITLQRDNQHINMIVEFDDAAEFRKTFNYKC